MMSFGIKKEFKNKRGSIGIRLVEPFAKNGDKIWTTDLSGDNFNQTSERTSKFTSIGISFKYPKNLLKILFPTIMASL